MFVKKLNFIKLKTNKNVYFSIKFCVVEVLKKYFCNLKFYFKLFRIIKLCVMIF